MGAELDYKSLGTFETHRLLHTRPDESAYITVTRSQKLYILVLLVLAIVYIISDGFNPDMMYSRVLGLVLVVNLLFTLFYVLHSFYKLFLINLSTIRTNQIVVTPEEIRQLKDEDLPIYTILVPLYHETETLKKLTESIAQLDYPKDKLDVKLLLEEDDRVTIDYADSLTLPAYLEKIVVPHSMPKTKPKAGTGPVEKSGHRF
jgi:hypothetical protein